MAFSLSIVVSKTDIIRKRLCPESINAEESQHYYSISFTSFFQGRNPQIKKFAS